MSIYRSAVKKPVTTALIFVAFAVFGVFSLMNTSLANFPDFDANVVLVMSSYPGASASDIENNLTKVLENTLNGVADLKDITSSSKENVSIVVLEFEYGTDIDEACNNIRDKLDLVNSSLPDGASVPVLFKFGMDDMPVLILSAKADKSLMGLDKILDDKLVTPLGRVKGVGTISVSGAPAREIHVYCDPNKLKAYGLSVSGISQIIAAENRNVPSGSIDIGAESFTLRVEKEFKDPSELMDIVVSTRNGQTVYLRDVATVIDGLEEKSQESFTNGERSAMIAIQKQSGANTVNLIRSVKQKLKTIEPTLPSDVRITTVVDSSTNILNTLNSLKETIFITLLVVMLVVYIFLGRWRATFIIVLSIPIALLGSLIYLYATGNTLNIISMSALSIAIGMVVDDAIVVLENISTHLERGEKPTEAAVHGTSEVGISVIASTLTMLCVFLPLTMVSGMAGIMFKQLGWIVSIIMIISTTAALTLVPMLCSRMLSNKPKNGRLHRAIFDNVEKFLNKISDGYAKIIGWCMVHRKTVIFSGFAIFVAVLALLGPGLKTEYFPHSDEGRLTVSIQLPVGTEQTVTGEFAKNFAERIKSEIPEIQVLQYRFGQASTDNAWGSMQSNGSYIISMNINLGSMEDRKRSSSEIADIIRKDLREYPEVKKGTVSEGMGGVGGAASVRLEIYGYDFDETDRVAREIQGKMLDNENFTQVVLSRDDYTPEYQVDFDRTKLALNGLNSTTAAAAFSAAMNGSVGSFYREEGEEYNIRVIYDKKFRSIPGYEGDLWLPVAVRDDNGNPKNGSLKHSTDGGATWTDANGMGYCEAVGYGISKTGKGYPAIYAFGKVDDVLGVFVSDDQGATWTRVNDDAHEYGGLANGEFVMGDMNTYGVVYMSTAGRGIAVRVPSDWDMGTSESTAAVKSVPQQEPTVQFSKLATLEGSNLNLTVNNARVNVALFDLKGNRVFSKSYTSSTVLSLNEMVNARGAYIVRVMSGSTLMLTAKVNLH